MGGARFGGARMRHQGFGQSRQGHGGAGAWPARRTLTRRCARVGECGRGQKLGLRAWDWRAFPTGGEVNARARSRDRLRQAQQAERTLGLPAKVSGRGSDADGISQA